jgi:hypothetical protein
MNAVIDTAPDQATLLDIPAGHVGPVSLPGTNREIWWTGRVAIGLRYEGNRHPAPAGTYATWLQELLLSTHEQAAERSN